MQDQIISVLKSQSGYVSGEQLSRDLKISRAGIWKNIDQLRRGGYDIIALPHHGYQLKNSPDKLFPREIQFGLKTKKCGQHILYHDAIESTMQRAFQAGLDGAQEGTLVCAEGQTRGKGRMGRRWVSPKGKGLYCSLILRPNLPLSDIAPITLLSAVALCQAIKEVVDLSPQIKWPNDIFINGKKVSGILTEMSAEMDRIQFVVVGIGINVNNSAKDLIDVATSLKKESGKKVSRVKLMQALLCSFEGLYDQFLEEGAPPIIEQWKADSLTLGKRVRIEDQGGSVEGEAIDLDAHGGLMIKDKRGVIVKRMSGEVVFLN
ncbi:biotin--[acetyl-CoA-carboxylase] ligase [Candidatus Omnitrophota bacterium]